MKHPNSALNVFLGVGVTSCACPSHSLPLVPTLARSVLSAAGLSSAFPVASGPSWLQHQGRRAGSPMALQPTRAGSPGPDVSEIPGKGFPAFPLILFFFFLHQCSLFTPYCIWQSQEERRRREKRHKVCRGEKRGVIVNVCLSLAGGTAPPWDAGFPAPRAASLLRGLLREGLCSSGGSAPGSSLCTGQRCRVSLAVSPSAAAWTPLIINWVWRQASHG